MTSVFVDTLPRLIVILVNILILVYIINLEKKNCVCSSNWKRDFIKYFTIILIVLNVFVLLVPQFKKSKNKAVLLLLGFLALVNLFNIAILLVYYVELSEKQKTGCGCSVNWKRHIMLFPVLSLALLYIFLLVRIMLK